MYMCSKLSRNPKTFITITLRYKLAHTDVEIKFAYLKASQAVNKLIILFYQVGTYLQLIKYLQIKCASPGEMFS